MATQQAQRPRWTERAAQSPLTGRLSGDAAAAGIAATVITPVVAVIDRTLVEKSSAQRPLVRGIWTHGVSAITKPTQSLFTRPFGLVWVLYAATYTVANTSDTLARHFQQAAASTITFLTTTVVNVPLGVWKDVHFAKSYGSNGTPAPSTSSKLIKTSTRAAAATFLFRDSLTIFGSFTLAPHLSAAIPDRWAESPHSKAAVSQLTVPVLSQLVATPAHLFGLDLYNRQQALPVSDRLSRVRRDLPAATVIRCLRIIPAFGIGCLANMEMRSFAHELFESY